MDEASIDIKKLDNDRPIDEYSAETQSAIEKVDQELLNEMKTLPLSKSEQMSRLREAWHAEGTPDQARRIQHARI